jgi:hypothetical protein
MERRLARNQKKEMVVETQPDRSMATQTLERPMRKTLVKRYARGTLTRSTRVEVITRLGMPNPSP